MHVQYSLLIQSRAIVVLVQIAELKEYFPVTSIKCKASNMSGVTVTQDSVQHSDINGVCTQSQRRSATRQLVELVRSRSRAIRPS
jgi:hypothetical protein